MSLHRFYPLARPFLFTLDPEAAHELTLMSLDRAAAVGVAQLLAPRLPTEAIKVMGLTFPNRIGLAAGLDKNAEHLAGLATFGFGFIEAGTVTPRPQPGNPKPRMFRLPQSEALINRLGFNNGGVAAFVRNVERSSYRGVLGINIGKNFDTPNEKAVDDYLACLRAVYARASYITVNVSSPNTKGLRDLQGDTELRALLTRLLAERDNLAQQHGREVPLVVKIAPDLDDAAVRSVAGVCMAIGLDGIIATNTTLARDAVAGQTHATETGGLSGRPVQKRSTEVIRLLASEVRGALPIIGVGGIMSANDAREKIAAGASLVQIYTGLVYHGPQLIADCVRALQRP